MDSFIVIGLLVGIGVTIIVFVIEEQFAGEHALLQPRLFKVRAVAIACPFLFL